MIQDSFNDMNNTSQIWTRNRFKIGETFIAKNWKKFVQSFKFKGRFNLLYILQYPIATRCYNHHF